MSITQKEVRQLTEVLMILMNYLIDIFIPMFKLGQLMKKVKLFMLIQN